MKKKLNDWEPGVRRTEEALDEIFMDLIAFPNPEKYIKAIMCISEEKVDKRKRENRSEKYKAGALGKKRVGRQNADNSADGSCSNHRYDCTSMASLGSYEESIS